MPAYSEIAFAATKRDMPNLPFAEVRPIVKTDLAFSPINFVNTISIFRNNTIQEGTMSFYEYWQNIEMVLKNNFELMNKEAIVKYLHSNASLLQILIEATSAIPSIFQAKTKLVLELVQDFESSTDQLFIIIKSNLSPISALNKLELVFDNWLIPSYSSSLNKINVTCDFL